MNGMPQEDRLSAYFDDQLSLEERAQFEKELTESASLRLDLDELRQLSGLLQTQPVMRAPVELYPSVMRAIERDTLLPKEPAAGRRFGRLIVTAACAVAAVAVAVLVIQTPNGIQVAQEGSGRSEPIVQKTIDSRPQLANKIQDRNQAPAPRQQFEISRSDLTSAKVGDVIEAVSANGSAVSVIRLTVVDRQAGVAALQVILAGQGQVQVQGAKTEGANGLVAVYLQSDPNEMAAALKEIGAKLDFESLSINQSESLDRELQGVIAEKNASVPTATVTPKGSVRVIFVLVNDAKPAAKPVAKDPNGAAD